MRPDEIAPTVTPSKTGVIKLVIEKTRPHRRCASSVLRS
jgi:hypothetical protein